MELLYFDKTSSVSNRLAAELKAEIESTLSNVTSLQSQSLYDCDSNNEHIINNNNKQLIIVHTNNSSKSLIKKAATLQQISSNNVGMISSTEKVQKSTKDAFEPVPVAPARRRSCANTAHSNETEGDDGNVNRPGHSNCNLVNNSKTATILVSKTKTKTGLPLLLKNSIN